MVTGGIRRRECESVLNSGVAMAGIATALAIDPALPRQWREGREPHTAVAGSELEKQTLAALATMSMVQVPVTPAQHRASPQPMSRRSARPAGWTSCAWRAVRSST